jgi:hypothetical protein
VVQPLSGPVGASNREELTASIERLRRDFLSSEPEDLGNWLSPLQYGARYHAGTLIRHVGLTFSRLESGIHVPERMTSPPMPVEMLSAYQTARDVFGSSIPLQVVERTLRMADIQTTLAACAGLLRSFDEALVSPERDRQLAAMLAAPYRGRAEAGIAAGNALVAPQSVMILAKLALLNCPRTPRPAPSDTRWILLVLLAIQDNLNIELDGPAPTIDGIIGDARAVATIVQAQVFHQRRDPAAMLAHSHLRWRELPRRGKGFAGFRDLAEAFTSFTGVSLDDFVSVGLAVWSLVDGSDGVLVDPKQLNLRLPSRRLNAALKLFTASPTALAAGIRANERHYGSAWSFDVLRQYPIVRLGRKTLLVLSPRLVLERVFDLVRMDIEQALVARGDTSTAKAIRSFWESMCEEDASESLSHIAMDIPGQKRLYRQSDMQAAFDSARRKRKCSDFAIDYPGTWVVGDITASSLNREAMVGGSLEALEEGLAKITAKARQIESTIQDLEAYESQLTGSARQSGRNYVPVLVMAEGFPVNPATSALVQHRLARATKPVLQAPGIGPLHLIDLEELTIAEALAEKGRSFLDLLRQHERGNFRGMSFKDFILLEAKLDPGHPTRLRRSFEDAWRPVLSALRVRHQPTKP